MKALDFLKGGGEMGELIRNYDWVSTPLGTPEMWPSPLKVAVQLMLNTEVPTYLCWSSEFIQFYNDALIPALGSVRHPSMLGKPAQLTAQRWEVTGPALSKVMKGESFKLIDLKFVLNKNGSAEDCYFDIYYSPIYLDDLTVGGIHSIVIETTDKVKALHESKANTLKFQSLIQESPFATCLLVGKQMIIELANDPMFGFWGKGKGVIGQPLAIAVPELKGQPFLELLDNVFTTGETYTTKAAPAQSELEGKLRTYYFDYSYTAIYDPSGKIYGVLVTALDVTANVMDQRALEHSRNKLDFAIQAAELGTWDLNPATYTFTGNDRLKKWFGLNPEDQINLYSALDAIAEKDRARVTQAIERALQISSGGHYDIEYTIVNPLTYKEIIVKAKGKALFDKEGKAYNFSGTLEDVTEESHLRAQLQSEVIEQIKSKEKLEESELFVNSVIYNSPIAKLVFTGHEMVISIVNEKMLDMLGRDHSIQGKTFIEAMPELKDTPLMDRMKHVFETGETYIQQEEELHLIRFGIPYTGYYNYIYKALRKVSGEIYGIIVTATEVTDQVAIRAQIESKEKELRDLISIAPLGICVVSGSEARIEEVNERFITISGKKPEQFKNATYWEVFPEVKAAFSPVLENVFKTGVKFSIAETELTLIRHGVPEKIFVSFDYVPFTDNAGEVSKIIVLVVEVTHQVEIRRKIEQAVEDRTKELAESNLNLKRSNSELEQFAYIASHDLQEPIRKISTFTQMLEQSLADVPEKSKNYFSKIFEATDRMRTLIRDVLAFSQVSQSNDAFAEVDLNAIIRNVETDFEISIQKSGAKIEAGKLPVLDAIPSQMTQLFSNLLSNSLKFVKPNTVPVITITCGYATKEKIAKHPQLSPDKKYYHIVFSDNGIGFDDEQADRIFRIFQRLHTKKEYEGTGIGLSICRKIVQTHQGHIAAARSPDGGATFNIVLPEQIFSADSIS